MTELLLPGAIEDLSELPAGTINIGAPLWRGAMQVGINCEDSRMYDGFGRVIVSKASSGLTVVARVDNEPIKAQIVSTKFGLDDTVSVTRQDVFDAPVDFLELELVSTVESEAVWLARANNLQVSEPRRLRYFCSIVALHALEKVQKQAVAQKVV